jgi:predicted nucleic acid-binding protein
VALTHLLDTSVLTRLRHSSVIDRVEPLVARGVAGRAGITDLEMGASARNGEEWDLLVEGLAVLHLIETTAEHVIRARQVQRLLAERSQRGRPIPDLLVAAAAERQGCVVVHYDADFDLIASVTGQPCEWVVPAGSID